MCPSFPDNVESSKSFPYPIESLVPQSKAMVLVDRVLEVGDAHIVVELTVRDDGLFSTAEHTVPAWIGLEYMAQTVAAFSGYHRKRLGQEIELGFLLGTRFYQSSDDSFRCGAVLRIRAEKIIEVANDMVVFDCCLQGEQIEATSRLNLLLPQDSKKFLAGKGI